MTPDITVHSDGKVAVSVVLPVLNEEANLQAALESVQWAAEVFVVDSGSSDGTRAIAERQGAKVVVFEYDGGPVKKKAWSLRNLPFANEWSLYMDGDERITLGLQGEIRAAMDAPAYAAYYIDRQLMFRGRELRSFRPDWNLRLFRHALVTVEDLGMHEVPGTGDNEIHEHFIAAGPAGFLRSPLLHNDYRGIGAWVDRHNRYATWEAYLHWRWRQEPLGLSLRALTDPVSRNRMVRRIWIRLPARPLLRFLGWLFVKRAILDGWAGLQYSLLMGWYEYVISVKVQELAASDSGASDAPE